MNVLNEFQLMGIILYLLIIIKIIVPIISSRCSSIEFSINYLNIPETIITLSIIKQSAQDIQLLWGGSSITQSTDAFKLFLKTYRKNRCYRKSFLDG